MTEVFVTLDAHSMKLDMALDLDMNDVNDKLMVDWFQKGLCPEQELMWILGRTLKKGDLAIDVGANIGFVTLIMAALVGSTGQVVSYEPGSNNLPMFHRHMHLNGIKNVKLIEDPLWCREEPVPFYLNSDCRGSNAIYDPGLWPFNARTRANPQRSEMIATTLDAYQFDRMPKVLKIDTEGTEQKILEGAGDLLTRWHPPYIPLELNPFGLQQFGCNTETLRAYMLTYGYELFFVHANGCIPSRIPSNTKVKFVNDVRIKNALFSTLEAVGEAWPEAFE